MFESDTPIYDASFDWELNAVLAGSQICLVCRGNGRLPRHYVLADGTAIRRMLPCWACDGTRVDCGNPWEER